MIFLRAFLQHGVETVGFEPGRMKYDIMTWALNDHGYEELTLKVYYF